MKQLNGFINIHRKFLEWEWYDDIPTSRLFLHLLLTANWKENQWHGITVGVGQRLTSIQHLAEQTSLSPMQVRRALKNLETTGEITRKTTNKYTLITVEKFAVYQGLECECNTQDNKPQNKRGTNGQQAENKRTTGKQQQMNKDNKENKDNNILSDVCKRVVQHLNEKVGANYKPTAKYIQEHISARLNDGYTEQDFYKVIDNQTAKWLGTDMEQYLTPDTLFRPSKFDKYLNAPMASVKQAQKEVQEKQTAISNQLADVERRLKTMRDKYAQADIKERMQMKSDIDWLEDEYKRLSKAIAK